MVESKLVELVVAGSNPVGHPTSRFQFEICDFKFPAASVAQLDRASDFGSDGCRFKSCRTRQYNQDVFEWFKKSTGKESEDD
jgi:hypothetical protein